MDSDSDSDAAAAAARNPTPVRVAARATGCFGCQTRFWRYLRAVYLTSPGSPTPVAAAARAAVRAMQAHWHGLDHWHSLNPLNPNAESAHDLKIKLLKG